MKNNRLVSELRQALRDLKGLEILLQVGLKKSSDKGKISLLAGCVEGEIVKYASPVKALLWKRWPAISLVICDDSIRFDLSAGKGGVAICDSTSLVRQLKEWTQGKNLGGQHRPWAVGYWLPEALCGDLATAKVLYDAEGIGVQIRKLVVPYSTALSQAIVAWCVDEIRQKLKKAKRLLEQDAPIELGLFLSDLAASMVRLAFARSRIYLRGFGSLGEQAKILRSSDMLIYELALKLSKRDRVKNLMGKIEELL